MACLAVNTEYVAVTCGTRVLAQRLKENKLRVLEVISNKETNTEETSAEKPVEPRESSAHVLGLDLSRCHKWLVLCSDSKQLDLWDLHSWQLVSSRQLVRVAERVNFTPSCDNVIVADRSGDAYTFSVEEPKREGSLLLGHLSMLLDVLVSEDERYVITCDRDEKIRVSHFPNAYNIQSYCLGHTEFVSCLSFLPHDTTVLASGSGDGTLRLWDYVTGKQQLVIPCYQHLPLDDIPFECPVSAKDDKPDRESTDNKELVLTNHENVPAIMHLSSCVSDTASLVAVCFANVKACLLFRVSGDSQTLTSSVVQVVNFPVEPLAISLSCGFIWNVSSSEKEPLSVVNIDDRKVPFDSLGIHEVQNILKTFNDHSEWFRDIAVSEHTNILYKRKFANVEEYLERKKARLTAYVS